MNNKSNVTAITLNVKKPVSNIDIKPEKITASVDALTGFLSMETSDAVAVIF